MKTVRPDLANEPNDNYNKSENQGSTRESHISQCEQDYESVIQAV